jgi:hypothetical protein
VSPVKRGRARQATRGGPHHARQSISEDTMPVAADKWTYPVAYCR